MDLATDFAPMIMRLMGRYRAALIVRSRFVATGVHTPIGDY
jgi:hypothetical protein